MRSTSSHTEFFFAAHAKLLLLLLLTCKLVCSTSLKNETSAPLPTLKILEYEPSGVIVKNILSVYPNSDLVFGSDENENSGTPEKKIVFECSAQYPVQWSYSGDGSPEFLTSTILDNDNIHSKDNAEKGVQYSTSISFERNLREKDTGNYTCSSLQAPYIFSSVFIFVPGLGARKGLFASTGERNTIYFSRNESTVRIPCSVTHPNVLVSLHKFDGGLIRCPLNDSVTFNPKSGFHLDIKKLKTDLTGIYICAAAANNAFQIIEHKLVALDTDKNKVSEDSSSSEENECSFDHECPFDEGCILKQCKSPCQVFPLRCESTKACVVRRHNPSCEEEEVSNSNFYLRSDFQPEPLLRSVCGPNACGRNAECVVIEYKAHCVCFEGYTGNGQISCHRLSGSYTQNRDPCYPNNCGAHTMCIAINGHPVCSCLSGYTGYAPYCQLEIGNSPECSFNYHCSQNKFCNTKVGKCEDSCQANEGFCGDNAMCEVRNHDELHCFCNPGFTGDPYRGCKAIATTTSTSYNSPCHPSPCGQNANCRVIRNEVPYCFCPVGMRGNPRIFCSFPNSKLQLQPASTNLPFESRPAFSPLKPAGSSYQSPCKVTPCGKNAECRAINGMAGCRCFKNFTGNPYKGCARLLDSGNSFPEQLYPGVTPSPNNQERPNTFRPSNHNNLQCLQNTDCVQSQACYNFKCVDPCSGSCGSNARCKTVNHTPVCSCPEEHFGDPFIACRRPVTAVDPCVSCGPNSVCKIIGRRVHCLCDPRSVGSPPKCKRSECRENSDCPNQKVCERRVCVNPCVERQPCGTNAKCQVENHETKCFCITGYSGDPLESCRATAIHNYNPCETAPCGANSECKIISGLVKYRKCQCNDGFYYSYYGCRKIETEAYAGIINGYNNINIIMNHPCSPATNPCGPNSICKSSNGTVYCRCEEEAIGSPPYCLAGPSIAFGSYYAVHSDSS